MSNLATKVDLQNKTKDSCKRRMPRAKVTAMLNVRLVMIQVATFLVINDIKLSYNHGKLNYY
jgi:hypothetical protein